MTGILAKVGSYSESPEYVITKLALSGEKPVAVAADAESLTLASGPSIARAFPFSRTTIVPEGEWPATPWTVMTTFDVAPTEAALNDTVPFVMNTVVSAVPAATKRAPPPYVPL